MDKELIGKLLDALEEIEEYREHMNCEEANAYLKIELSPLLDTLMGHEISTIRGRGHDLRENFSIDLAHRHITAIVRRLVMRPMSKCKPANIGEG